MEAEGDRAAGGVKMEELDSSLLDLPAVGTPQWRRCWESCPISRWWTREREKGEAGINTDAETAWATPA